MPYNVRTMSLNGEDVGTDQPIESTLGVGYLKTNTTVYYNVYTGLSTE